MPETRNRSMFVILDRVQARVSQARPVMHLNVHRLASLPGAVRP